MNTYEIAKKLPLKPSEKSSLDFEMKAECYLPEGGILWIKRADILLCDLMGSQFALDAGESKTVRGAECKCSQCGEVFEAGYVDTRDAGGRGIILTQGEDGYIYVGYTRKNDEGAVIFKIEDTLVCPFCEETLIVKNQESISECFYDDLYIRALRFQEIINIDEYTAVVTWQFNKIVPFWREMNSGFEPVEAHVIDSNGEFKKFFNWDNHWKEDPEATDGLQDIYFDSDSINETKVGGFIYKNVPDLEGKTGEKTGLSDYINRGGRFPVTYLKTWQLRPFIENLMKTSFGNIFVEMFDNEIDSNIEYEVFPTESIPEWDESGVDLQQAKPHKMLGLHKEEFRELCENIKTTGEFFDFMIAKRYSDINVQTYHKFYGKYGSVINEWSKYVQGISLEKIDRYLKKQKSESKVGFEMFIDYYKAHEVFNLTDLIFPKSLNEAHERISNIKGIENSADKLAFRKVHDALEGLEWSDGELCVRLPIEPAELISEGNVLRHCVGSYVKEHARGKSVIFFVRHARRPERSYYTLNISFENAGRPKEVQLHGYGNERHGPHKEHSHKIPKKVRDFVDRWEQEILYPWNRQKMKKKSQK